MTVTVTFLKYEVKGRDKKLRHFEKSACNQKFIL